MFRDRQINHAKEFDYSIKLQRVNETIVNILCLLVESESGKDCRLAAQIDAQVVSVSEERQ